MSDHAPTSPLHLLGHFSDMHTGAERELPDLAAALVGRRECRLWSDAPPHPDYAAMGVREVRAAQGDIPRGGMLLMGGVHVATGPWLREAGLSRLALRYNLPQHERLARLMVYLQHMTALEPELLFVSGALRDSMKLAGEIEPSLISLTPYLNAAPREADMPFTVGRVSRDTLEKFHPDDVMLYRMLAAQGVQVKLMGATCLAPWLGGVPNVELQPAGHMPVARFLEQLDVFFYRTDITFEEPYGRVIFEAMAAGVPVVAGARGGYAERVNHGEDGFLFSTVEEAFDVIDRLRSDGAMRKRIGQAGRACAMRLHGDEAIARQLEFYLRDT